MTHQIEPDMNWQERLNAHEEAPPQDGWPELKESLELDRSGLREKMLALESAPPLEAWPRIQKSLTYELKPVPRIIPFLRRHAGTAGIAASLLLVVYFYSGSSENIDPSALGLATGISSTPPTPTIKTPETPPSPSQATPPESTMSSQEAITARHLSKSFALRGSGRRERPSAYISNNVAYTTGENYIEICNQEGLCDRLTYKLEDWAPCLNATSNDALEIGAEKIKRIEAWRARLEQGSYIPAAGHFFDIGEMAQFLQSADLK